MNLKDFFYKIGEFTKKYSIITSVSVTVGCLVLIPAASFLYAPESWKESIDRYRGTVELLDDADKNNDKYYTAEEVSDFCLEYLKDRKIPRRELERLVRMDR